MRLTSATAFSALLIASLATACGDDGGTTTDACASHTGCGGGDGSGSGSGVSINDPEGGNIIFEYIYFDTELQAAFGLPTGVTTANRVMAYFMNAQTPQSNPLPTPGTCVNLESTKGWPLWVGTPHTDLDVGTLEFTGMNTAGMAVTITPPKITTPGKDAIGRPHDIYYQQVNPDAAKFVKPDSYYTVKMGGAGSIPATTIENGIYIANTFTVTAPDVEGNGPLSSTAANTVKWTPAATNANLPPKETMVGEGILGVTWLVDTFGSPTHICVAPESAGQFTIPATAVAEYKQVATARGAVPSKVILLRNAIVHRLARLPNGEAANKRRIDMLSVMCWAQLMDTN
jgi:hypothetical protein